MEIDAIVSPIALYPDQLVAQILGAATYPDQVQAADNFVNGNKNLQGDALMKAVDGQPWDPSVKALTQFPSVLDQMSMNMAWTSSLGDASYNQQADVMASVQRLRKQAKDAGNLKSTKEITVVQQAPQTIVIQPTNPQVVYVPQYNPAVVYGAPYQPPGYSTGAVVATGLISFGLGMAVGAAISNNSCCGWGWGGGGWGCNWHGGTVVYQHNTYVSRSTTFYGAGRTNYRNTYYGGNRPTAYNSGNRYNGGNNRNVSGNTVNNVNINTGNTNNAIGNNRNNNNNVGNNRNNNNVGNNNRGGGIGQQNDRGAGNQTDRGAGNQNDRGVGNQNDRGFGQQSAARNNSSAFSGGNRGGNTMANSERGRASMGAQSRDAPAARGGERGGGGGRRR